MAENLPLEEIMLQADLGKYLPSCDHEQLALPTDTYIHGRANQKRAIYLEADLANYKYFKNYLEKLTFSFVIILMLMFFYRPRSKIAIIYFFPYFFVKIFSYLDLFT